MNTPSSAFAPRLPLAAARGARGALMPLLVLLICGSPVALGQNGGGHLAQAKLAATPSCGGAQLGQFIAELFEGPTWEERTNDDGTVFIDVYGPLKHNNNKLVVARIRYVMTASGPLAFGKMDITGITQPEQTYRALAKQVCP